MAKVFHADVARMLVVYLRSLGAAKEDALIVADPRPVKEIHEAPRIPVKPLFPCYELQVKADLRRKCLP